MKNFSPFIFSLVLIFAFSSQALKKPTTEKPDKSRPEREAHGESEKPKKGVLAQTYASFLGMIDPSTRESSFRFSSFSELQDLTSKNKDLIQAVLETKSCSEVQGRVAVVRMSPVDGKYLYAIPLGVKFKERKGNFDRYEFRYVPATYGASLFKGSQWFFDHNQEDMKTEIFVPRLDSHQELQIIQKGKRLKLVLNDIQLYNFFPTKYGETERNCDLKKVVKKIVL